MMVSVIICTYNRPESLLRTLTSLENLSVASNLEWEVIVVDNSSNERTQVLLNSYAGNSNLCLRCCREKKLGLSHARNRGIGEARGQILSFLDDDVVVDREWLGRIVEAFELFGPDVVGGKVVPKLNVPLPHWYSRPLNSAIGEFDKGDDIFRISTDTQIVGIGANLSFRRGVFDEVGLFNPGLGRHGHRLHMGEETELFWRIKRNGGVGLYYPKAFIYHCVDANKINKTYFRRWYYRIGEWNCYSSLRQNEINCPSYLGIPRWMFRSMAKHAIKWILFRSRKKYAEAFTQELSMISILGYCAQKLAGVRQH